MVFKNVNFSYTLKKDDEEGEDDQMRGNQTCKVHVLAEDG